MLDGYFARMYGQQSSLGRMLDPIADKLLVASCLLMLAAEETIRGWSLLAAVIILCREILVSGLREYLAELRVSIPVSRLAKWKTTWQLVAVGFLIAGDAGDKVAPTDEAGDWSSPIRAGAALALGAGDALHRLGLYARRASSYDRRMTEARLFRVGSRAGRQGGGRARAAAVGEDRRRTGELAARARRGIRARVRESESDPRRHRQEPRQARHGDRRRPRDRVLSADDGRMNRSHADTIRLQREDFDAAAERRR